MRYKTVLSHRVKQIATELSDLQRAVTLSSQLELNSDKSCVRRCVPFEMKEIGPEYSVYVEGLSSQWNHDTVSKRFHISVCLVMRKRANFEVLALLNSKQVGI